ncbi:response regulator [Sporosarcina pasteurii]|uniref:Transcriptional regulatory protein n=1 Tax=Sporosarcina pasteurii TaxID=1474 RepID=A0A380C1U1_SPOPA|nr:response regulator [Sporosarcina pasteurii]MDS9471571.1 response regulator [Sporosarcina pasteurii]QBQ04814.1 response regulator [Sporosarcina pasteurii]SUJ11149.1 Transcriptional regulatory protein dcuR [Sporosarcina pasteurii]
MINVLIIEDDPMVAKFNAIYLESIPGFSLAGIAENAEEGWAFCQSVKVDLILLDVYMGDKTGLELLQDLRREDISVDVMIITAANDKQSVQTALHYGAVDYLIKPFSFERFQEALTNYAQQRSKMKDIANVSQEEVDSFFLKSGKEPFARPLELPKGLTTRTLSVIVNQILKREPTSFSAADLAMETGISRVSVRKYINHLAEMNLLQVEVIYQETGRPLHRFYLQPGKVSILKSLLN